MSLPAYPAYRESGVPWLGRVPAHWNLTRLRFIAQFNPSKSEIRSLPPETEVSFLPMDAIGDNGSLRLDATRPLSAVEQGYTYFRDGDLLIAKITPCFENGKGALAAGLHGGIGFGTTELIVVRPLPGRAVAAYLQWLFVGPDFRNAGTAAMYGAGGQKRVPDEFVRNFVVAVPPPAEQRAIAAFLDRECGKIDALVAEQERLIALLKEKRQAVISHAVTKGLDPSAPMKDSGVPWLGQVPAGWGVALVKSVASCNDDVLPEDTTPDQIIEYVEISDVEADRGITRRSAMAFGDAPSRARRRVRPGDVLVSTVRTYLRAIATVPEDCDALVVSTGFAVFRPRRVHPRFLSYVFYSEYLISEIIARSVGVSYPAINASEIARLPIPLPPPAEQRAIAAFLDRECGKIDTLTSEAERAIALLKERRAALISAAVTGKIDVRGLVPAEEAAAA